eukprot:TRINITY_DN5112_c2_g1_i1.p1 TRINITY_DN5112_c2_g1~~TRINITY_DN5112_c2_g1_i1.p1  ORF type:complete len:379 (+),score=54.42 TRINITY_DN5112_c2_g1_i1:92-1228(+)
MMTPFLFAALFAVMVYAQGNINYNNPNNFAESFAYSTTLQAFLTGAGSNPPNALAQVGVDGTVTLRVTDPRTSAEDLSTLGIKVNDSSSEIYFVVANRTIAFGGNPTGGVQSVFAIANLNTFEITQYTDLSMGNTNGRVSANDLVYDGVDSFYITDAAGGRILKVVRGGSEPSVVVSSSLLLPANGTPFGVDGIIFMQTYLLVNNIATGGLFKIVLSSLVVSEVILQNRNLSSPDGMILRGSEVYVAQNLPVSKVAVLTSSDAWATAIYSAEGISQFASGSAVTFLGSTLYMSHAPFPFVGSSTFDVVNVTSILQTTSSSSSVTSTSSTSSATSSTSSSSSSSRTSSTTTSGAHTLASSHALVGAYILVGITAINALF